MISESYSATGGAIYYASFSCLITICRCWLIFSTLIFVPPYERKIKYCGLTFLDFPLINWQICLSSTSSPRFFSFSFQHLEIISPMSRPLFFILQLICVIVYRVLLTKLAVTWCEDSYNCFGPDSDDCRIVSTRSGGERFVSVTFERW